MQVWIGYTVWNHVHPMKVMYVEQLPGEGGKDWGYTDKRSNARPLSVYWRRRFERDMERCGRVGSFAALDV